MTAPEPNDLDDFPPYFTPKLKARSRQRRERRAVVNFLLTVDHTQSRRSYEPPSPPSVVNTPTEVLTRYATATLLELYRSLMHVCQSHGPRGAELQADPVFNAAGELLRKSSSRPSDLRFSSKLYRAIDDLECARASVRYQAYRDQFGAVVGVLRDLSGWSEAQ